MNARRFTPSAPGSAGGSDGRRRRDARNERPTNSAKGAATPRVLATLVTTTSYGTWLPGDLRGYVDDGVVLPANPRLLDSARALLSKAPVYFNVPQIIMLDCAIHAAAQEFGYRLTDLSIESWHLHWIIEHGFDPVEDMVGRLKTRMRQFLRRERIWTAGYCHRCMYAPPEIKVASAYIGRHEGCRLTEGRRVDPKHKIPRQSRGLWGWHGTRRF